jgi:uncharacterized protein (DUF885 family)
VKAQFDRRQFVALLAASSALAGCATTGGDTAAAAPTTGEAGRANALYDRLFNAFLAANPETATSLGLDTGDRAGLRARLGSNAPAARFGFASDLAAAKAEIDTIDLAALPAQARTSHEVLAWFADRAAEIVRAPYGGFDSYPIPFTLTQLTGSYQSTPDFLDSTHPLASSADAEAYLSRMTDMATNIGHEVERSRAEAAQGVIPPAFVIAKTLSQTRAARDDAARGVASGMAASIERRARAAGVAGDWNARAGQIATGPITAALDRQIAHLENLAPRAGNEAGVSRLPGGLEFYATCLRQHTSTALTPTCVRRG